MDYITKLDRLIEEALCNCAKNSFANVYDTLHGSGTIEPLRLIRLELDLNGNKVRILTMSKFSICNNFLSTVTFHAVHKRSIENFDRNF